MIERYRDGWYQDVPLLIQKADALFAAWRDEGKPQDRFSKAAVTKNKIYDSRGWLPSKTMIDKNFDAALKTLNPFYLPTAQPPGPAFVFPLRDLDNVCRQAQVRPVKGSPLFGKDKYLTLGYAHVFKGPRWFGNDWETIRLIIKARTVVLVEGPFDLLACRLIAPGTPALCTLTKKVSDDHIDYLSILGVKTIHLMFDNEKDGDTNRKALNTTRKMIRERCVTKMNVEMQTCPEHDASKALQKRLTALELRNLLQSLVCKDTTKSDPAVIKAMDSILEYYEPTITCPKCRLEVPSPSLTDGPVCRCS
jgi:hypothetical protein